MKLTTDLTESLLKILKIRFLKNTNRHRGIEWQQVEDRLLFEPKKLWSLNEMDITEGEPDVVGKDEKTGAFIFVDCSPETLKAAEVFVTTMRPWNPGKNISQKTVQLVWRKK